MCNIPHTHRRAGRYVFRRRVHFRNLISRPVTLALGTADPRIARTRAAMLSARFAATKARVDGMLEEGRTLTGTEIEALFRAELEEQLRFYVHSAYEDAPWSSSATDQDNRPSHMDSLVVLVLCTLGTAGVFLIVAAR